jgi:hypothetical protein
VRVIEIKVLLKLIGPLIGSQTALIKINQTQQQRMDWQNLEQIREAIRITNNPTQEQSAKPSERWGHCAVAVNKEMFIFGGYHGKL